MGNLPNITQAELAVLAAAVLLLFIAPGLLLWTDERRRRRVQLATLAAEAAAAVSVPVAEAILPMPEVAIADADSADAPQIAPIIASLMDTPAADDTPSLPAAAIETHDAPEPVASHADEPPIELLPLSGPVRHRIRFDELHRVQLPDWPPEAIRNDPERSRLRLEAEQAAAQFQARLSAALLASPYPARSQCLGAADADAAELRLSFLLFPVLWPVSQNQAVAQAVVRIDRGTGEIRGWVDALRPQELADENRREIREAGGEI